MAKAPSGSNPVNDLKSYTIPNMVQGVSQQAAEQRRDTQAEEQFDCINSPVNGCEARPPFEVIGLYRGARFENCYARPIARGSTEYYLAVFANDDTGANVRVLDLFSGDECSVTLTNTDAYLETLGPSRDTIRSTTLNDTTFVINREVPPLMDAINTAPKGFNEGIVYFKAGGYSITFQVNVEYNGNSYTFLYTSPDNSTVANAQFITTNQLAATFYKAFTGGSASTTASGSTLVTPARTAGSASYGEGVGAAAAGQTGVTGSHTLVSLGFYVALNGNVILIGRADSNPFTIDVSDGVGDTYIRTAKDNVQAFADLPKSCFLGFTTMVRGENKLADDDYFVQYQGADGQSGYWQECVKPGTQINFDPNTMPYTLVNTGYQQFQWKQAPWGPRVSGDAVNNSKDPTFVGKLPQDIFFSNARLAIMTEGSNVWARSRNPYVFFPDSAQTTLDTDPVDVEVGGGDEIALLRAPVQINESTFLWAEGIQFKINAQNDVFKQDSVQADPSTKYEFSSACRPAAVGQEIYFATEPGDFSKIISLAIQDGKPRGDTDITAHVPRYIPKTVAMATGSTALDTLVFLSDVTQSHLYYYNYLLTPTDRLQSAWNTWRLPAGCSVRWIGIRQNQLRALIQRDTWGAILVKCDLSVNAADPGFDDYLTRADLRLSTGQVSMIYNAGTNETRILLPFPYDEALANPEDLFVAQRVTGSQPRGYSYPIVSVLLDNTLGCDVVTVKGDASREELYIGLRIVAERTETEYFLRSPSQGALSPERLQVVNVTYTYSNSGYWRAEVTPRLGAAMPAVYEMTGRRLGDPGNTMGAFAIRGGKMKVPVNAKSDEVTIRLVNDSFLPSRWTRETVEYRATFIATPTSFGSGSQGGAGR